MFFFSVVIPVYNRKKYICRCLESVLRQSFKDFEIVIVDDGSCDGSDSICDKYKEKFENIKVVHQKHSGASKARNTGIKNAWGQFVIFIDSDDYIPRNYLKEMKKAYEKYGTESICCTSFKVYSEYGIRYFQYRKSLMYSVAEDQEVIELMKRGLFNSSCNKLYQLSLIKKYDIKFPENIDLGEDLIFNLKYLDRQKKFKFLIMNKVFYNVWETRKSLERGWRDNFFEIQKILLKEKIKYIKKWNGEGKIFINETTCEDMWYYSCMKESIVYYIAHMKNAGILKTLQKILEVKGSSEYLKYVKNNKKNSISKMVSSAILDKLKQEWMG